jgi:NAD(P)-dependent dehydrogenase (short-subunit alcohol dehydrogenase family)
MLSNFGADLNVVVIGASGGIGNGLLMHLMNQSNVRYIHAFSRRGTKFDDPRVTSGVLDLLDDNSVAQAAQAVGQSGLCDIIIVATGILHDADGLQPEKALRDISHENFARVFAVNTAGPAMVAKYFLPLMNKDRRSVFGALSARVGSISDNALGGWYAYRASKVALNMVLKNAAIEMGRRYKEAIVVGLHPGTVDTDLSAPFKSTVQPGKLFSPDYSAEKLLQVISNLRSEDSGHVIAWDGEKIAP